MPVISLVLALTTPAFAQPPRRFEPPRLEPVESGTATVAGRVIDAVSKQPVSGVEVELTSRFNGMARSSKAKTDERGAYAFVNIAEGTYSLLISNQRDYLLGCYVTRDAPDRCANVSVLRDQTRADIDLAVMPMAIARGRVVDQNGLPVKDAASRPSFPGPNEQGSNVRIITGASATTRADGTYELRGVQPGQWYIEADVPSDGVAMRTPIIFYPGVFSYRDATAVEFRSGSVTANVDFIVPTTKDNTLTVRVSPGPLPIGDVRTSLIRSAPLLASTIKLGDDGTGTVKGVLEGRYFVAARGWVKDRAWAAYEMITFVPPSVDLSLQLMPAGRISGRIVAQNGGLPPLDGVVVSAAWVDGDTEINPLAPDQNVVSADGSFRFDGLFGRRAIKLIGLSPEWRLHSLLHGRSIITSAVEVPLDTTVDVTIVVTRR